MALFGLSPLILSFFASTWFTRSQGGLDVPGFTAFLAILTGVVHVIGAVNMTVEPTVGERLEDSEANSETMPLLPTKPPFQAYDKIRDVLRDSHFWVLALVVLLTLGSVSNKPSLHTLFSLHGLQCEMVIANIGTISLALPVKDVTGGLPATSTLAFGVSAAATQVRLLSLSNTISRITTGPMADFISPVASHLPSGSLVLPRQHKVSRVAFLLGSCLLMTTAFLWMAFGVTSQEGIWAFRFVLV